MVPEHDWTQTHSDQHWHYWSCQSCTNHHMQVRRSDMARKDDHTVSTCPRCGNYSCTCVR
jgi:hypothetical protein